MIECPRLRMLPEFNLRYASLTFNSKCNANCVDCCGQIMNKEDMPLEKIKEVLNVVIQGVRIKRIYPSCSAEMSLIPYINEIVKYIDEIQTPGLFVQQDTNARYIPDGFIETLNSCTCNYNVSLSIWGHDEESWNSLQGKGSFELVLKNIKRYLKELKHQPTISFPYITETQYQNNISFVTELCKEFGYEIEIMSSNCDAPVISAIKDKGKIPIYVRRYTSHLEDRSAEIYDKGKRVDYIDFNNCGNLFGSMAIDSLGYIYPCTGTYNHPEHRLGNVFDYSPFTYKDLLEILHSDKAMNYMKGNFTAGEFSNNCCNRCTARICN